MHTHGWPDQPDFYLLNLIQPLIHILAHHLISLVMSYLCMYVCEWERVCKCLVCRGAMCVSVWKCVLEKEGGWGRERERERERWAGGRRWMSVSLKTFSSDGVCCASPSHWLSFNAGLYDCFTEKEIERKRRRRRDNRLGSASWDTCVVWCSPEQDSGIFSSFSIGFHLVVQDLEWIACSGGSSYEVFRWGNLAIFSPQNITWTLWLRESGSGGGELGMQKEWEKAGECSRVCARLEGCERMWFVDDGKMVHQRCRGPRLLLEHARTCLSAWVSIRLN